MDKRVWWVGLLAAVVIAGCVVSTDTVPGETGPQGATGPPGETGDSVWKQGDGYIYYDRGNTHGELARFSDNYPTSFMGKDHTITLGGDATAQSTRYVNLAFGNPGPPYSVYGGIGVKLSTSGSSLVFGTSDDYGAGITNEAITIDRWANLAVSYSEKSKQIHANDPTFRSGAFSVSAIVNSGDGYVLTSARGDGTAPTSIHGNTEGEIWFQVEGGTPNALDPTPAILITRDRVVSIGKIQPNPAYHLDVAGIVNASAFYVNGQPFCVNCMSSDARLKQNIAPLPEALSRLLRLRGVTYEWREPDKQGHLTGPQTGMIAQEVEKVFPEWVGTDREGFKTLTIRGFEALAIESFRELKTENDTLRREVAALTGKADRTAKVEADLAAERAARQKLEARLAALETRLAPVAHP